MPKRKRDHDHDDSNANPLNSSNGIRKPRSRHPSSPFNATFRPYIRSLASTLESARLPERLKLGRRLKETKAKRDDARAKRLEEEVECLRVLDCDVEARAYLVKVLGKVRVVGECEGFKEWVDGNESVSGAVRSEAEKNLLGRLLKADGVRETVQECVEAVKDLVVSLDRHDGNEMDPADRGVAVLDREDESADDELDTGREGSSMSGSMSASESGSEDEHDDRKAMIQTNGKGRGRKISKSRQVHVDKISKTHFPQTAKTQPRLLKRKITLLPTANRSLPPSQHSTPKQTFSFRLSAHQPQQDTIPAPNPTPRMTLLGTSRMMTSRHARRGRIAAGKRRGRRSR